MQSFPQSDIGPSLVPLSAPACEIIPPELTAAIEPGTRGAANIVVFNHGDQPLVLSARVVRGARWLRVALPTDEISIQPKDRANIPLSLNWSAEEAGREADGELCLRIAGVIDRKFVLTARFQPAPLPDNIEIPPSPPVELMPPDLHFKPLVYGVRVKQMLGVKSRSDRPLHIQFDSSSKNLTVNPSEFTLVPGGSRRVVIEYAVPMMSHTVDETLTVTVEPSAKPGTVQPAAERASLLIKAKIDPPLAWTAAFPGQRMTAVVIDHLILMALIAALSAMMFVALGGAYGWFLWNGALRWVGIPALVVLHAFYFIYFPAVYAWTPGQKIMRIQVWDLQRESEATGWRPALLRYLAAITLLEFWRPWSNPQRRTRPDLLTDTIVILDRDTALKQTNRS